MHTNLKEQFGDIDIYLFDQLLKGRFAHCACVADLGCGTGRNSYFFLKNGHDVWGIDKDAEAIAEIKKLVTRVVSGAAQQKFIVGNIEDVPFPEGSFDLVICSAVLHFANNYEHFEMMLKKAFGLLKTEGYFFARLATTIGIEELAGPIGEGRYILPDGTERFLLSYTELLHYTASLNAELYEPIKTTNVNNLRAMTTWCMVKK